jgi:hypothetical protein
MRSILLSQFTLDLRERAAHRPGASAARTSNLDLSSLRAAAGFVQQTISEDFGEPLYPFPEQTCPDEEDTDAEMAEDRGNSDGAEIISTPAC